MSKADIIRAGTRLGVDYALTVSCYQADAEGAACGRCDSCRMRAAGFAAADSRIRRATASAFEPVIWRRTSAIMRALQWDGSSVGRARPF